MITFGRLLYAFLRSCVMIAFCVNVFAPSANAQQSHIISFDAPGTDMTAGSFNGTFPGGINNFGAITGSYVDTNDVYRGFIRNRDGKFVTFQVPGADTTPGSFNGTLPNAINDLGVVTGAYYDSNGFGHGFLRSPDGKFTTFNPPGVGGYGSNPIFLNLEGSVVGYYTDSSFNFRAFLRNPNGHFITFTGPNACDTGTPNGCYGNEATNITLSGVVVGNYEDNSGNFVGHMMIRYPNGNIITFDAPNAGTGQYQGTGCPGCFAGLNQWGAIAATFTDANSISHGFLRNPKGEITTYDVPGGGSGVYQGTGCFSDCPVSLNDFGALTGVYLDSNYVAHGYLRNPEGKIVTFDPAGSTGTSPYGMNDLEAITGYYYDANSVAHGFLRVR
jgi:hypothetical protein